MEFDDDDDTFAAPGLDFDAYERKHAEEVVDWLRKWEEVLFDENVHEALPNNEAYWWKSMFFYLRVRGRSQGVAPSAISETPKSEDEEVLCSEGNVPVPQAAPNYGSEIQHLEHLSSASSVGADVISFENDGEFEPMDSYNTLEEPASPTEMDWESLPRPVLSFSSSFSSSSSASSSSSSSSSASSQPTSLPSRTARSKPLHSVSRKLNVNNHQQKSSAVPRTHSSINSASSLRSAPSSSSSSSTSASKHKRSSVSSSSSPAQGSPSSSRNSPSASSLQRRTSLPSPSLSTSRRTSVSSSFSSSPSSSSSSMRRASVSSSLSAEKRRASLSSAIPLQPPKPLKQDPAMVRNRLPSPAAFVKDKHKPNKEV